MSNKEKDNKFNEELEKELQNGLHHGDKDGGGDDDSDDFTVRVKREEYIVKRRFYDKDKALETAETLRRDKRNLVEDNIEGQALSSSDDDDEKVDWDKLVDAGLVFDPPIAEAADKKPGEPPVGLAEEKTPMDVVDDKALEKTLVVKRPKKEPEPEPEPEEAEDDEVAFEDEEAGTDGTVSPFRTKWIVLGLLLVVCVATLYMFVLKPSSVETPESGTVKKTVAPVKPQALPERPKPVVPEKKAVVKPMQSVAEKPLAMPRPPVPSQEKRVTPAPAVEKNAPVAAKPSDVPASQKVVPVEVKDHFPYTVHVSSYRDMDRAKVAVGRLKKKGYTAFSGMIHISGKGDWYRVYAGYFVSKNEASTLAGTIKKTMREDAMARKTPWTIQVGEPGSMKKQDAPLAVLQQKGYAVNTVPVVKGSDIVRILTGAFSSEDQAKPMLEKMSKDGFDCSIVKR